MFESQLPEIHDYPQCYAQKIYGHGCLVADEDMLSKSKNYTQTLTCYSTKGVLYEIKREDFMRLLIEHE
jgi:hypothetical protein